MIPHNPNSPINNPSNASSSHKNNLPVNPHQDSRLTQPTSNSPSENKNGNTNPMSQNHNHKHNHKSLKNIGFIGVIVAILAVAFVFMYEFLIVSRPSFWIPVLIIFLIIFILVEWSYFATACTDPGRVPFYYGMSPEIQNQARKYCLLCHNFKPERTHHCSICRRCVLNMDHHCPWLNNCVGFRNRKFFILFLFYISIGLIFMSIIEIIVIIDEIKNIIQTKTTDIHFALKVLETMVTVSFAIALTAFFIYHLNMVLSNTTTLEQLGRKRVQKQHRTPDFDEAMVDYNVGEYENFEQVFGQNKLLWPFPVAGKGPKGNGTSWPKSFNQVDSFRTRQFQGAPLNSGKPNFF